MLDNCPTCGADQLEFLGTLGDRDHYRCKACGMDCSESKRETFAEWADKRLEWRLRERVSKRRKP